MAVEGDSPAIKLPGAGVQLGVKGNVPCWLLVETIKEAESEPIQPMASTYAVMDISRRRKLDALFTITILERARSWIERRCASVAAKPEAAPFPAIVLLHTFQKV